jgi:hypothetical protein
MNAEPKTAALAALSALHLKRLCLARLALRRALTWEFALNAFLLMGTAAAVGVTAWVGAVVLRLP